MKVSTTYSAKVTSAYVGYAGSLDFRINDEDRVELELTLDQLRSLHRQVGERIKYMEKGLLEKLQEELEKATNE